MPDYINEQIDNSVLYTELFTPLFVYFRIRTHDYELASDLTQSVFLKFLKQENKPKSIDHSKRLLFTIARTLLIDHWRSNKNNQSFSVDDIDIQSSDPDPQQSFENNESVVLVQSLLEELSDQEKEIVTLRITSNMDYADIAENLKISKDNTRQIYSRSLKKIRKLLEDRNINYDT